MQAIIRHRIYDTTHLGTINAADGKALGLADKFVVKGQERGMKFEI
jgi:hypothetical protein